MATRGAGEYDLRVVVLRRVLGAAGANGEAAETWPDPATGTNEYYAARESLTAGETIAQGVRQSLGFMKLRVRGRAVAVAAEDRVRKKFTGETYAVTGVHRERGETVILCERVHQQAVGQ